MVRSDEAADDEKQDQLTPLSQGTKRASSTSTTASSPSKRSKNPAVRAIDNNMREYNDIARNELSLLQTMWQERKDAIQDERKALEMKVKLVNKLARECGVTPSETPSLFKGVVKIIHNESVMDLFIDTDPKGRMIIIKEYAEDAVQSVPPSRRQDPWDDGFEEFISDFMDDDDYVFMYCMYQYAQHIDKHLTRASSTSTTASSPSKRSKSPAVRAMDNNMREYNDIARNKLNVLQTMWQERKVAIQDERKALEMKVKLVNKLARECGVTPSETPSLFKGVVKIIQIENVADFFIATSPAGRLIIIEKYARVNN